MLDVPVNQEIRSLEAFKVQQTALYSGPQNPYNEKIKYGDKGKDWAVVLCVRVSDCFGAFVFYCVKDRVNIFIILIPTPARGCGYMLRPLFPTIGMF